MTQLQTKIDPLVILVALVGSSNPSMGGSVVASLALQKKRSMHPQCSVFFISRKIASPLEKFSVVSFIIWPGWLDQSPSKENVNNKFNLPLNTFFDEK